MNKIFVLLSILCLFSFSFAVENYTVGKQISGLQSGNNSGNDSNYTVSFIFPLSQDYANGTNYSATPSQELLGWYIPTTITPPFNMTLLAQFLGMSKTNQTITALYTTLVVPTLAGFTVQSVTGLLFLLLGLAFMLIYTLKYWGGNIKLNIDRM